MRRAGAIVLAAILIGAGACTSDDGAPSVSDVNDAAARMDDRLAEYLTVGGDLPTSIEDIDPSFFEDNEERLVDLRAAYDEWIDLFEDAVEEGNAPSGQDPADLRAYAILVDDWLTAQEEQATLSRECFDLVDSVGERAAATCYAEMLDEHAHEWQDTADRLNEFVPGG